MEGQGSSFIPKSSARVATTRGRGTRRIYILSYISYIVFFGTLFAVAGVYLYASSVDRSLSSIKDQLITERNRFSTEDIESIKLLDNRLDNATRLVNESAAPSLIFNDIETIVASNIDFSGMKYSYLDNGQFELTLTGEAEEFNEVLWQQNLFKNSNLLRNATITKYDYTVAAEGGSSSVSGDAALTFTVGNVSPTSLIPYTADPSQIEQNAATSTASTTVQI